MVGNRDRVKGVDAGRVTYKSAQPRTAARPPAGRLLDSVEEVLTAGLAPVRRSANLHDIGHASKPGDLGFHALDSLGIYARSDTSDSLMT